MNALICSGLTHCALSPCKSNKTLTDLGCCSSEEQLIHYGHFVYPWMRVTVWIWILLCIQCGGGLLTVMLKHWFTDCSCFRNRIPQGCLKWLNKPLAINKIFIIWNSLTQFSHFPVPPSAVVFSATSLCLFHQATCLQDEATCKEPILSATLSPWFSEKSYSKVLEKFLGPLAVSQR